MKTYTSSDGLVHCVAEVLWWDLASGGIYISRIREDMTQLTFFCCDAALGHQLGDPVFPEDKVVTCMGCAVFKR